MKRNLASALYDSQPMQILLALIIYAVYASVLGVALVPSIALVRFAARGLSFASGADLGVRGLFLWGLALGAAVYLYFIWVAVWMATLIRLISLGMKPGVYPKASLTTLRWLIHSGIHTIAVKSILPYIPVSYFSNLYFRIMGAKIGKNVYINTNLLSDAYLMTLEDGVILGGGSELTCHMMERENLILSRIRIGRDSLIGTGAFISPGVDIGERCTVGARCYLRRGAKVADGTVLTVVAGLPMRTVHGLEKGRGANITGLGKKVPKPVVHTEL